MVSNADLVKTPSGAAPNPADFSQFTGSVATYKVSDNGKVSFVVTPYRVAERPAG